MKYTEEQIKEPLIDFEKTQPSVDVKQFSTITDEYVSSFKIFMDKKYK